MSERVTCEKHGLVYDPATQSGCVLCRREEGEPVVVSDGAKSGGGSLGKVVVFAAVVIVVGAGTAGFFLFLDHMAAPVGEPCTGTFGCTEGANCVVVGTAPLGPIGETEGRCYLICESNEDCHEPEVCRHFPGSGRYCITVTPVGGTCDGNSECDEDALCIVPLPRRHDPGVCRQRCVNHQDCPGSTVCVPIQSGMAPSGLPPGLGAALAQHVCLDPR